MASVKYLAGIKKIMDADKTAAGVDFTITWDAQGIFHIG